MKLQQKSSAMSQALSEGVCWITTEIDLLPDNEGTRYEIVDVA